MDPSADGPPVGNGALWRLRGGLTAAGHPHAVSVRAASATSGRSSIVPWRPVRSC